MLAVDPKWMASWTVVLKETAAIAGWLGYHPSRAVASQARNRIHPCPLVLASRSDERGRADLRRLLLQKSGHASRGSDDSARERGVDPPCRAPWFSERRRAPRSPARRRQLPHRRD